MDFSKKRQASDDLEHNSKRLRTIDESIPQNPIIDISDDDFGEGFNLDFFSDINFDFMAAGSGEYLPNFNDATEPQFVPVGDAAEFNFMADDVVSFAPVESIPRNPKPDQDAIIDISDDEAEEECHSGVDHSAEVKPVPQNHDHHQPPENSVVIDISDNEDEEDRVMSDGEYDSFFADDFVGGGQ